MGTNPGERLMGQLERRAEAISEEFNSQAVVNTLGNLLLLHTFQSFSAVLLFLVFQFAVNGI